MRLGCLILSLAIVMIILTLLYFSQAKEMNFSILARSSKRFQIQTFHNYLMTITSLHKMNYKTRVYC